MNRGQVCVAAALVAGSAMAFDFVKDGVSQVTFEGVDRPALQLAVKEYGRIVEKTTGAKAVTAAPNRIAFVVTPELGGNDTYEIRVEGWTDAKTGASGERLWLVGNNERSCWFAMCDILGQMGCRWFWEGEAGEYLPPPTKDLALADPVRKTTAAFPWRHLSAHPNRDREMWYAHNRLNPIGRGKVNWGQTTSWGGHSFNWIRPKDCETPKAYFEKYPEQWAEVDGIRVDGNHCYTNPDTIKTFQDWILRFWEEHPDVEFLTLTARDSPVYCHCKDCAKVGDSSTLFFSFLNKITAPAIKKYPQKKYATIAYAFYSAVPKVKLDRHFIMHYCMYDRCYKHRLDSDCPVNPNAMKAMRDWKESLGFAPNVYGYHFDAFGGGGKYIPLARIYQDEIRWARDFGVRFWFTEFYGGYPDKKKAPSTWGVHTRRFCGWLATELLWDPDLDLEAKRRDFCSHVFGAAAEEMAEYQRLLEERWEGEGHLSYYNNAPAAISDGFVRDPELVEKIDALFATAQRKAAGDPRAAGNVKLERDMWEPWRKLATGPSMAKLWTMTVPYSKTAPNMDGTGTDPVWATGATETNFVHAQRKCKKDPTEATVLRTDKAFYLRFTGWYQPGDLKQTKTKRDDSVYMDDGIELCLDPMNTRTDYYWICVNTLGTVQDALASVGMNINSKWNGDFRVATKVYDDRWVIEVEFPYATFGAPKKGKAWLMGLNRCGPGRYESWTDATVHSPNSFRTLIMEDDWEMLWDGRTSAGWVGVADTNRFPSQGWKMEDGVLSVIPTRHFLPDGNSVPTNGGSAARGGDICTVRRFRDFHFKADFRLTPRANSGFKYFFEPDRNRGTALEYQVLDPDYPVAPGVTEAEFANKRVASAYCLFAANAEKYLKPRGEWNTAEIVARGRKVEHWLNGVKVLEFVRGDKAFQKAFARSKWAGDKFNPAGDWGCADEGRIQIQDHQDEVSFRNIKIREFKTGKDGK